MAAKAKKPVETPEGILDEAPEELPVEEVVLEEYAVDDLFEDEYDDVLPAGPSRLHWVWVALTLLLAVAAGLGAAAVSENKSDDFTSRATVIVNQEPALTLSRDAGILSKLSALRVKYAGLVSSSLFAQSVGEKAGLPAGFVHATLSPEVPPGSLLFTLSATTKDGETAQRVASAAATVLIESQAKEQTKLGLNARQQISLTLVSPARQGVLQEPSRKRSLEFGGGAFLAVLVGAAVLRDLVRQRASRAFDAS